MRVLLLLGCAAALAVQPAYAQSSAAEAVAADQSDVDPRAVEALKAMSTYLQTLKSFRLISEGSLDVITVNDQKVQLDMVTTYLVGSPGIRADWVSDQKNRQFYFDGKNFTLVAPTLGYYATVDAPGTNREFLDALYEKTGIELPLADLFRWADADHADDIGLLTSAFSVGTATLDGVATDHWAYRTDDFDWELWMEQGDRPLPRKFVLIDRTDPTLPTFTARLTWQTNPTFDPAVFTYVPAGNAVAISFAAVEAGEAAQ
ncbi:MAG TPA: DUF2092 domain-containing protein [Croceibacterium sp.]